MLKILAYKQSFQLLFDSIDFVFMHVDESAYYMVNKLQEAWND